MLNVLLESCAPRPRRIGGTLASVLLHAGLIAAAVALTLPRAVDANAVTVEPREHTIFVPAPLPKASIHHSVSESIRTDTPLPPTIAVPHVIIDVIPVDVGPVLPADDVLLGGPVVRTGSSIGNGPPLLGGASGAALDEHLVDHAPRVLGRAIEPRYPAALREAGVQGRVLVQFVVDTLGRAELDELQVVESAHPQFVESVRAALARYRFSPGEAGGRRVRTRVQLPFDFALVR